MPLSRQWLLLAISIAIYSAQSQHTNLTDCECFSGWTTDDIDCSRVEYINTLQSFLSSDTFNCSLHCDDNIQCQQAYSLLFQYYTYCPLGVVSESLIRAYYQNSTCIRCQMVPKHYNANVLGCIAVPSERCTSQLQIDDVVGSIDDIVSNCVAELESNHSVAPSQSPTNSPTAEDCTDLCQARWWALTSHQRSCPQQLPGVDYALLDALYTDTSMDCIRDCNNLAFDKQYTANCSAAELQTYFNHSLDLDELRKQTHLCFYGLNVDDPTNYDLVCVERQYMSSSGVLSYHSVEQTGNEGYWSAFGIADDMNQVWLLVAASLVFFMQTGFTFLEAGAVKAGNVQNILFKNMMDAAICAVTWWLVGYAVAYGDPLSADANGFIGVENILITDQQWARWFFGMAFACTASTIVSGAVAERFRLEPYFIYTIAVSTWIYPVCVHWIWSETGWLSPFNPEPAVYAGAIDFAGSSVIHMVGGITGLCGAWIVGPRLRRFDTSKAATSSKYYEELQYQFEFGHNVPFQVFGLLILWFGFYGFNPGSTLMAQGSMNLASKVAVNTTLSAASGGVVSAAIAKIQTGKWHIPKLVNGILAALASITASCGVVSSGWAIFIGVIGSALYYGASWLVDYVEVDDVLDAFAVHGVGGSWGVLSAAFFSTSESLKEANYPAALYQDTTTGERIATNLVLLLVIIVWTVFWSLLLFGSMKWCGILRVTEEMERSGIDIFEHGGSAVNIKKPYNALVGPQVVAQNKRKEHKLGHHEVKQHDSEDDADDANGVGHDGNFARKVRESSLEKRLGGVADNDD